MSSLDEQLQQLRISQEDLQSRPAPKQGEPVYYPGGEANGRIRRSSVSGGSVARRAERGRAIAFASRRL